jgi:hypothetical protein
MKQLFNLMVEVMLPLILLIGWSTILFWLTLPLLMAFGLLG